VIPLVLIHGFGGGRYEFKPIIQFLNKHGFSEFHEFTYAERFGQLPIEALAQRFARFVSDLETFDIIGISQGGIIARSYIRDNPGRVRKCITLCSPHKGSFTAYFSSRPGVMDLRPGSRLLNSFQKNDALYFTVYNPLDLMVVPGKNAVMDGAINKKVYALLHPLTFWRKPTLEFILQSLQA
jgi:triacylglycerol lipase